MEKPKTYLLRRHGAFWRENARGYVNELAGAGLYTLVDAKATVRSCQDVSIHAVCDYAKQIEDEFKETVWRSGPDGVARQHEELYLAGLSKLSEALKIPHRYQRKRTKGWRTPPKARNVTRPGKLGNPFRVYPEFTDDCDPRKGWDGGILDRETAYEAVVSFENMLIDEAMCRSYGYPSIQDIKNYCWGL